MLLPTLWYDFFSIVFIVIIIALLKISFARNRGIFSSTMNRHSINSIQINVYSESKIDFYRNVL